MLDLDRGDDLDEIVSAIESKGLHAIIHSTHSHLIDIARVKSDDYRKFVGGDGPVTEEGLREYLSTKKDIDSKFLENIAILSTEDDGIVVQHLPIPKYRVAFPLARPFTRQEHGAQFEPMWKAKYLAQAGELGLRCDESCIDVSRVFYLPSCEPGAQRVARTVQGRLLDIDDIQLAAQPCRTGPAKTTVDNPWLSKWIAKYGATFEIEAALRSIAPATIFRQGRSGQPGVHIDCPFEDTHTQTGGTGTFVVNASENDGRGFGLHCCHAHCLSDRGNGTAVERLVFVKQMLDLGWLDRADLENAGFGGGPVTGVRRPRASVDLRVVDRNGRGLDAAVFHGSVIATGDLDLDGLNQRCGIQMASDVTAEQFAGFIEAGRVTVKDLMGELRLGSKDPYEKALLDLAKRKALGDLSQRDAEVECTKLRQQFGVKQKTIDADLVQAERRVKDRLCGIGLLNAEETGLIPSFRDYASRYAIVLSSGQTMVYDTKQRKLSQALTSHDHFERIHKKDWIEVEDANGGKRTIYPAREFLNKPPRNARFYEGGFVFQPSNKTVGPDQCNLYHGFQIKPDPSGSCDLVYDLFREVWTRQEPEAYEYVKEWFWHILAHPGASVGTALALRGDPGHGKSIIFEHCLPTILGDMLLRVTNPKLVLGDYNEALAARLVITLEEACFAGDKKSFDSMKELVTGKQVTINPKFKAPFTVNNYARLVILSNHDHFMHIEPKDRRYTVLESSPTWQGTDKFVKMLDQWNNGGAQRFLHDAVNHTFRTLDNNRLVITTKLKTDAESRQVANSRSPLDQVLVDMLLTGHITTIFDGSGVWSLDAPLAIESLVLEKAVQSKVGVGRAPIRIHAIIDALTALVGDMTKKRPKLPPDEQGCRRQLATQQILPPRRQAIEHARKHGLITREEYDAASMTLTEEEKYQKQVDWFRKNTPSIQQAIQKRQNIND